MVIWIIGNIAVSKQIISPLDCCGNLFDDRPQFTNLHFIISIGGKVLEFRENGGVLEGGLGFTLRLHANSEKSKKTATYDW